MNLLYFVPFWPHRYTPFLFREVAWMRGRGHRVAVVSMRKWPDGQCNVDQYKLEDVPVLQVRHRRAGDRGLVADAVSLVGGGLRGRPPKPWRQMRADLGLRQGVHEWVWAKKISAFARRHRADVVDAHWMSEAAAAARVLQQTDGVPYAVTSHGNDVISTSLRPLAAAATVVSAVSRFLGEDLQRQLGLDFDRSKLRIRPHGLPAALIATKLFTRRGDELSIVMTGRLDPEKRPLDLVEAVGQLASEFPTATLTFIGGGVLEKEIHLRAAAVGLGDRVIVTGGLAWDAVMTRVRTATVYVQTSAREGFGVAPLEAASQGLPAVVSRTGAHAEIVQHGRTGIVFEPGDVAGLTAGLRRLLADADVRQEMGRAALEHVRASFVFEDLMPRVERILESVANGRPPPP